MLIEEARLISERDILLFPGLLIAPTASLLVGRINSGLFYSVLLLLLL